MYVRIKHSVLLIKVISNVTGVMPCFCPAFSVLLAQHFRVIQLCLCPNHPQGTLKSLTSGHWLSGLGLMQQRMISSKVMRTRRPNPNDSWAWNTRLPNCKTNCCCLDEKRLRWSWTWNTRNHFRQPARLQSLSWSNLPLNPSDVQIMFFATFKKNRAALWWCVSTGRFQKKHVALLRLAWEIYAAAAGTATFSWSALSASELRRLRRRDFLCKTWIWFVRYFEGILNIKYMKQACFDSKRI